MSAAPARVAVIGGGMAGLAAAYELQNSPGAGAAAPDWVLYERAGYLGGKVLTERTTEGFVVEGGPDSFIADKPWPMELARKVGVYDRLLDSNEDVRKSWVYSKGRLHELPEGLILMVPTRLVPFAFSSLISWPGKFRMGMDLLLPRGKAVGDESLGDFVRRRLGSEALAKVAEPIVAGIHAGDPEQMSLRASFPMFHEMEEKHRSLIVGMVSRRKTRARRAAQAGIGGGATGASTATGAGGAAEGAGEAGAAEPRRPRAYFLSFATGLSDLSEAVVAALPADRLRTGVAVERLERLPAGDGQDPGYRLTLSDGTVDEVAAVVLATPAFASSDLLADVAPGAAEGLGSIPYVSTATVSLAFDRSAVGEVPQGFGVVVPRAEGRGIMATTFSSAKFAQRAPDGALLLRAFVGRAGLEKEAELGDRELVQLVRAELRHLLNIEAEPRFARIFRWPQGMPQYRVGHQGLIDSVEQAVAACPGVEIAGGYLNGIGIGDCIREGAAAAQRALAHVHHAAEPPLPGQPADVPAGDGVED